MDNISMGSHPGDNLDQTSGPPFLWMSEPCHPLEEPHFGNLYVQLCHFGHYPALMTIEPERESPSSIFLVSIFSLGLNV